MDDEDCLEDTSISSDYYESSYFRTMYFTTAAQRLPQMSPSLPTHFSSYPSEANLKAANLIYGRPLFLFPTKDAIRSY